MSFLSLAALPAVTHVARDAVAAGAQVGKGFANLLSSLAETDASAEATSTATTAANGTKQSTASAPDSVSERSAAFSQRLTSWLRQQPWLKNAGQGERPLKVELTLDQLDQPHATLSGQPSAELDEALANDPSWLQQFRDLALDRIEQLGSFASTASLPSLTIQQESATIDAQHQWNS